MAKTEEQKAAEQAAKSKAKAEALVAELATFGITNTSGTEKIAPLDGTETVEQLTELVKHAKADKKAAEQAAGGAANNAKGPIAVKYRDHVGNPTERTFSLEDHGPDFAKLAEEFKATNAAKIIE